MDYSLLTRTKHTVSHPLKSSVFVQIWSTTNPSTPGGMKQFSIVKIFTITVTDICIFFGMYSFIYHFITITVVANWITCWIGNMFKIIWLYVSCGLCRLTYCLTIILNYYRWKVLYDYIYLLFFLNSFMPRATTGVTGYQTLKAQNDYSRHRELHCFSSSSRGYGRWLVGKWQ